MKQPFFLLFLCFCLGIAIFGASGFSFCIVYLLSIIFLILCSFFLEGQRAFGFLLSFLFFLLGICVFANYEQLPLSHIKHIPYRHNYPYIIKGIVTSPVLLKENKTSFVFKTDEIQLDGLRRSCCGNILVYLKGRHDLDYGQELILTGILWRLSRAMNGNPRALRDYFYRQKIFHALKVKHPFLVKKTGRNRGLILKRFALDLKEKLEKILDRYLDYPSLNLTEALTLGNRNDIPRVIYNLMTKTGTVHILIVSGFHVGIVSLFFILLLKALRINRRYRFYLVGLFLILYCLVAGAATPVVRSTIMAILFMFAYLVKREADIYNLIAFSGFFILGFNPGQFFSAGFQLSFASVISIVYFYPRLRNFFGLNRLKNKAVKFFFDSCLVSFSAWLGTAGLVAYYFRIFSPVTVLANLLIVPLACLLTLCGFSLIMAGWLCPFVAAYFASCITLLASFLLRISTLLSRLPFAYFVLD